MSCNYQLELLDEMERINYKLTHIADALERIAKAMEEEKA